MLARLVCNPQQAAELAGQAMGEKTSGGRASKCVVAGLVGLWYLCSVVGNNAGKVVLSSFSYPLTLSVVQFSLAASSVLLSKPLHGQPVAPLLRLLRDSWSRGLVLGCTGVVSNVMHRVALVYVHVSFVHTVKATQPLFSALLSWSLLGQRFSAATTASLLVVTCGVALAAFTEFEFSTIGFLAAEASAFSMSVANVCQKKFLLKTKSHFWPPTPPHSPATSPVLQRLATKAAALTPTNGLHGGRTAQHSLEEGAVSELPAATSFDASASRLDKNSIFFLTNTFSLLLVMPLWLCVDVPQLSAEVVTSRIVLLGMLNTATMVGQHFVSLSILAMISPVSHSLMNSCKRVVVIGVSVLYFGNAISPFNAVGIALAIGGVFLYQQESAKSSAPTKAAPGGLLTEQPTTPPSVDHAPNHLAAAVGVGPDKPIGGSPDWPRQPQHRTTPRQPHSKGGQQHHPDTNGVSKPPPIRIISSGGSRRGGWQEDGGVALL